MDVRVDGWAWLPKRELTPAQIVNLERLLTVTPRKVGDFPGEEPQPIYLYQHTNESIGVPRDFFFLHKRKKHNVLMGVSEGSRDWWPAEFIGDLRAEQADAEQNVLAQFKAGRLQGILRAKPGWGKTIFGLSLACKLKCPTVVVVHKEFLMDQWAERISKFVPAAKVGLAQQKVCDFAGKTFVLAMVHSISKGKYPSEFYAWPGLVIYDELHRVAARTWSSTPPMFPAKYRLGITATPRRKDGADPVFWNHIGPVIYTGREQRLPVKVKRVWTKFKLFQTDRFNPNLAPPTFILKLLCNSKHRNELIVNQLVAALRAERKIVVVSQRLKHLQAMENLLRAMWPSQIGPVSIGQYVGGRTKAQLERAAEARVIFATYQYMAEGLDIPALDTLFLTVPLSDVEQVVGRIQRPCEGKKDPIVVDFRDDSIPMYEAQAAKRDRFYPLVEEA